MCDFEFKGLQIKEKILDSLKWALNAVPSILIRQTLEEEAQREGKVKRQKQVLM